MTDPISGFASQTFYGKETTWKTEVAADHILPDTLGFPMRTIHERNDDDTLVGSRFREVRIGGLKKFEGNLRQELSHGNMSELLAGVICEAGNVITVSGSSPYQYRYPGGDLLADPETFTIVHRAIRSGGNTIRVYKGCVLHSMQIAGTAGEVPVVTFGVVGETRDDASGTNTDGVLDALSDLGAPKATFNPPEAVVLLGDRANALVAGDAVNCSSWSFELDNMMDIDGWGSDGLALPVPNGFADVKLSLTLERLDVETFRSWVDNNTELQCHIDIETNANHRFEIQIGSMTIEDDWDELPDSPELIQPTLHFVINRSADPNPTWSATVGKRAFALLDKSSEVSSAPLS